MVYTYDAMVTVCSSCRFGSKYACIAVDSIIMRGDLIVQDEHAFFYYITYWDVGM